MKERLDVILTSLGLAESREKAKAIIMSGNVYVDGQREDKAGAMFDREKQVIEVKGNTLKYVSRGGLKLEKAVDVLQNGAVKVYAVDVGHGQLAWKLRNDDRVVCMEQTNFRYMRREEIPEELDFASVDVSFISLTKILIPARELLRSGGQMVCLIKPQFEAGRDKVGKKGVVREASTHREVIARIADYADMIGFGVLHLEYSPIRGPEGNIEYLLHLEKREEIPEEVRTLTEHDAEEALKALIAERAGLSCSPRWEALLAEMTAEAALSAGQGR